MPARTSPTNLPETPHFLAMTASVNVLPSGSSNQVVTRRRLSLLLNGRPWLPFACPAWPMASKRVPSRTVP